MKSILCLAFLVASVAANSYGGYSHGSTLKFVPNKFAKIIRLVGRSDNAGNYNFDSETEDGTKMSETGGVKIIKGEAGATKTGSVSWISPDNQEFSLTYTADENGYRPVAKHLPVAPPMPEEIRKSLLLLPKLDLSEYDNKPTKVVYSAGPYSAYTAPMKPMAPPATQTFVVPIVSAGPPAPPTSSIEILKPLEAPTKTFVQTPEFVIDSEPARTFFRIGN